MDEAFIDLVIADLQNNSEGIDLFSKKYFFERKNAEHRSAVVLIGGPLSHRSRLSLLLREGMTEERRRKIFHGDYDLGNMKVLSPELCTYAKLVRDLYGDPKKGIDVNEAFRTIKEDIHRITGRKMQEHVKVDESKAFKVLKTLHLLTRRQSRLMQLLNPPAPGEKFSMSFRDSYPYERNQEQVWLIADLKAYLSAELSEERFEEIGVVFSSLHELMNNIIRNVEKILVGAYRSSYTPMLSAYGALIKVVEGYPIQHEPQDVPLDEELFIHLHRLEFSHFAVGYQKLISEAIPQCSVTPVFKELRALAKEAFPTLSREVTEYDPLISIGEVPEFTHRWQNEIAGIIERAMGVSLTLRTLNEITADVQNSLRNFYYFRINDEGTLQEETRRVSPWFVVAACCCVLYSNKSTTNFKPYWLGQPAQSGSVNSSNKASLFDVDFPIDNVPEEHRHIWANRLEWFADALRGHKELTEQRFEFRSAIVGKVLDICRTNDTDWMAQELSNFTDYIKGHALQHHRAG